MAAPPEPKDAFQMPQLPSGTVKEFIPYLAKHPNTPIADLLEPFKAYESELRKVYAQQPDHNAVKDGYVNLVPVFDGHEAALKIRARDLKHETDEEKSKYLMTLKKEDRKLNGSPAVVTTFNEFQQNFNLFSESSLLDMDWSNVVAAGSAVTTALLPVPEKWAATKRSLREYYHEHLAPASDVDLFLYGLNEEQALEKIKQIELCIKNSILHEVTTIRTKNAITIASQYPTRHVQIVLRLYDSVSQIITGFDVDCACAAYDGKQIYAAPRALCAFITQANTIDLSRRSPSYEGRLFKYCKRGFEVYWPLLDRTRIDPTIFERSFGCTRGLARLLILEKLPKATDRDSYSDQRRAERGRPAIYRGYRNQYKMGGNIKDWEEDEIAEWVETEEVASYHTMTVPYGPKYSAAKINRLLYAKDLLLNAEWNLPKDREVYLHRHPCFFGTAEEVLEDCCGYCPVAKTEEEIEVAEEETKTYISGKLKFISEDPGRQEIGSFNPITNDEWTTMAYVGDTARLCQAIVDGDLEHVEDWCAQESVDVNRRDYTGRTPLHLATMVSTPEIVKCLVDHGARLVARLVDGRTALHLAATRGNAEMIKILMEKSIANEEEEDKKQEERRAAKRAERAATANPENRDEEEEENFDEDEESDKASEITLETEDDEFGKIDTMTLGSFMKISKENGQQDAGMEDSADDPDFYDVDIVAWDYDLSALHFAILNGHSHVIDLLASEYGADVMLPVKIVEPGTSNAKGAIMTLVLAMTLPKEKAREVAKLLVQLGASSAQADMDSFTAFHYAVREGNEDILDILLSEDRPKSLSVLEVAGARKHDSKCYTPLASSVLKGHELISEKLLKLGAKAEVDYSSWEKHYKASHPWARNNNDEQLQNNFRTSVTQPIILAANTLLVSTVKNLLHFNADPQALTGISYNCLQNHHNATYYQAESLLDVVENKIQKLEEYDSEKASKPETLRSETSYTYGLQSGSWAYWTALQDFQAKNAENVAAWDQWEKNAAVNARGVPEKKAAILKVIEELQEIKATLIKAGAKSFYQLHPTIPKHQPSSSHRYKSPEPSRHATEFKFSLVPDMTEPKKIAYMKLFEATWYNDLETVESLTLSGEPPLRIAVQDHNGFSPFSLAVLRGHHELAKKIIQICITQYYEDDGLSSRQRWTMRADDSDDECYSNDENDVGAALLIFSELVNDKFTIDDLGEVATQVKSDVLPLTMIAWTGCFKRPFEAVTATHSNRRISLLEHAVEEDDKNLLDFLIKICCEQQTLFAKDDEDQKCYEIPQAVFGKAIKLGRFSLLIDMITITGAGLSLSHLVKSSGIEYQKKPKYYQGLSVGGKKRTDWAQAPGEYTRADEEKIPPLLQAARFGSIDSVEWFMSDAPLRRYREFAEINKDDKRIKTLEKSGKTFESTIGSWLHLKSKLILHSAIMFQPKTDETDHHIRLIQHLLSVAPECMEEKTIEGWTPLNVAVCANQVAVVSHLISKGANQRHRDNSQRNVLHLMLNRNHSAETDAKRLQNMIELFDKKALTEMSLERCNEQPSALTPLAYWLAKNDSSYKSTRIIEVLAQYSSTENLEMINGEGDLPLHAAIKQSMSTIAEFLLSLKPSTLYRENATGRTPLEMSRDMYIASSVEKHSADQGSYYSYYNNDNSIPVLDKQAIEFVEPTEYSEETKKRTFEICARFDAKMPEGDKKRRLVSLFEANEVAKRVASVKRTRWGGSQVVVNGDLIEEGKSDAVDQWLAKTLRSVQQNLA